MWNTRGYRYEDRENDVHNDSSSNPVEDTSADQPRTRNTRKRSTRKRSLLVAGGGLCVFALVASLVSIIVIFVLKSDSPNEKVSAVNAEVTIKNMDYSDKLADKDTIDYQNFTVLFCKQVKPVFSAGNLEDSYAGCIVNALRNGSLVVDFLVIFVSQDIPARKTVETILSVEVFGVFIFEKSSLVVGEVKQIDANDFLSPKSTRPAVATMSTNTGTISMESTSTTIPTITTSELATIAISTTAASENATTIIPATATSPNATVISPQIASSTTNMSTTPTTISPTEMTTPTYKAPSTTTSSLPLSTASPATTTTPNATVILPPIASATTNMSTKPTSMSPTEMTTPTYKAPSTTTLSLPMSTASPATTTTPNATVILPPIASATTNMSTTPTTISPAEMTTPTYKAQSTTTSSLPLSTEAQTIEQQCEKNATLIMPHPTECQLYYNCSIWRSMYPQSKFEQHMQECPYPTQFDIKNMKCNDFEKVQCGQRSNKNIPVNTEQISAKHLTVYHVKLAFQAHAAASQMELT